MLLTGYALGGAPGSVVGAVSAIASNVVFTEGPWTPWQMLAGGWSASPARARTAAAARPPRVPMALVCALAGFGYGLVLDLYTWLGYSAQTLGQYVAIEGSALPFNLTHAVGNAVFYLAFGPALLRALLLFRARLAVQWGPALCRARAARPRPSSPRPLPARPTHTLATTTQPVELSRRRRRTPTAGSGVRPCHALER